MICAMRVRYGALLSFHFVVLLLPAFMEVLNNKLSLLRILFLPTWMRFILASWQNDRPGELLSKKTHTQKRGFWPGLPCTRMSGINPE